VKQAIDELDSFATVHGDAAWLEWIGKWAPSLRDQHAPVSPAKPDSVYDFDSLMAAADSAASADDAIIISKPSTTQTATTDEAGDGDSDGDFPATRTSSQPKTTKRSRADSKTLPARQTKRQALHAGASKVPVASVPVSDRPSNHRLSLTRFLQGACTL
jgi:hypothetical protein